MSKLTKTMYDLLKEQNIPVRKANGDWASEVEAEFKLPVSCAPGSWIVKGEGSLRGIAYEFINSKPVSKHELFKSLEELFNNEEVKQYYKESHRTSTHIHRNIQEWGFEELINYLLVYYLCEPVFWRMAGKERKGNLFCLDSSTASGVINYLKLLFRKDFNGLYKQFDQIKYSSLNIGCITKFGSLEYRHLRGTNDLEVIFRWVNLIEKLEGYSKNFQNIKDLWKNISESPSRFILQATGVLLPVYEAEQNYSFCFQYYNEYLNCLKSPAKSYKFENQEVD